MSNMHTSIQIPTSLVGILAFLRKTKNLSERAPAVTQGVCTVHIHSCMSVYASDSLRGQRLLSQAGSSDFAPPLRPQCGSVLSTGKESWCGQDSEQHWPLWNSMETLLPSNGGVFHTVESVSRDTVRTILTLTEVQLFWTRLCHFERENLFSFLLQGHFEHSKLPQVLISHLFGSMWTANMAFTKGELRPFSVLIS